MSAPGSLWQALDEAVADHLAAQMGPASPYEDLRIASIEIGDTWTPDAMTKPGILIVSNDADLSPAGHGGGPHGGPHVAAALEYMVVAVDEAASYAEAKQAAQTLHARLLTALRKWPAIIAAAQADANAAGTGETADRIRMDRSRIEIRGRQGASRGKYYAIAVVRFEIDTTS